MELPCKMSNVSSNTLTTITSVFSIREGQRSKILSLYFDCLSILSSLANYITPFLTTIHQGISFKASNQGLTSSYASEKPPIFGFGLTSALLITPLATAYGKSYTYLCSIFLFLDDSYSLYCPICISYGTEKENLFDNQELLKLMIISFIFMNFIFDSRETQKGEMRHQALVGFSSLTPKSDKHLTSPHKITSESHIQVTRIKKMIIK